MSLGATLRRNTIWVLGGEIGARAIQFVFGVVLARLLVPEAFGLVVTVQILTGVLGFVAAHGMNDALVRAREIGERDVATIFTLQLAVCAAIVAALSLIAPLFASLFNDDRLDPLLRLASLTFLLRPFQGVPQALLQRAMRFREFSLLILLEVVISGSTGTALAIGGLGAFGLILAGLTGAAVRTLCAIAVTGWRPAFALDARAARELGSFGVKISLNEIIQYARIQTANAVVSRSLGVARVGLYNKADSLAEMPYEIVGGSAYQTLFRTLASIQGRPEQGRQLFLGVLVTASFYTLPMYLGLTWVAEPLVVTIYGIKWAGAALALQILAMAGPLRLLSTLSRAVAAAHNRLGREILIQLETWALLVIGILVGLRWGLTGVALGTLPAFVHNAVRMLALAHGVLSIGWGVLARALAPVIALNGLLLATLAAVDRSLSATGLADSPPLYLAIMVAGGALVYAGVFLVRPPAGLADESRRWRGYLHAVAARLSASVPPTRPQADDNHPIPDGNRPGTRRHPRSETKMPSTRTWPDRLRLLTDLGLWLAAAGILLVLLVRALVSIDSSHDTWWYHLPWAARLAGMLPADAFVYDDFLEQRFDGFGVLWEWLQGQLWRLTGRPESANLLSLASLLAFLGFLRARFEVPARLALLALIAVPLIQIHATAAHVDLPANLALTTALLLLPPLFSASNPRRRLDFVILAIACALTANIKLQLTPVVTLVVFAAVVALIMSRQREDGGHQRSLPRTLGVSVAVVLAVAVIFYVPIRNLAVHGNPFYPVALKAGPIALEGPQVSYISHTDRLRGLLAARSDQQPAAEDAMRPAAATEHPKTAHPPDHVSALGGPGEWLASVLEIGIEPLLGRGQWNLLAAQDPPLPLRYGGFFGWYVVLNLLLLGYLVARGPRRNAGWLVLMAAASLVSALLPGHEILRYYMFWMMLLVSLNLIMLRPQPPLAASSAATDIQRLYGILALCAFLLVVYATRAEFFQPRFYFVEDLIETRRDPALLAEVERHPAVCLAGERPPRFFIYSRLFNPGKDYRLKIGPAAGHRADEIATACGPGWTPIIAERADAGLLPARP